MTDRVESQPRYVVREVATGKEITPGDPVIGGRAKVATFDEVVYGPEYTGTARVRVNGFEYCPNVWGLTVERVGVGCPL
jgi:hypothetical protein